MYVNCKNVEKFCYIENFKYEKLLLDCIQYNYLKMRNINEFLL